MAKLATLHQPRLVTINQAAELYGCSTKTVRRMVARGELRAVRLGSRMLRIEADQLDSPIRPIATARVGE